MGEIQRVVDHMDPEAALDEIASVVRKLFLLAEGEARSRFIGNLLKSSVGDKVGSMVHL
jgi:hypothetical protein